MKLICINYNLTPQQVEKNKKKFLEQFDKLDDDSSDTKKNLHFFFKQVKVFCCVGV